MYRQALNKNQQACFIKDKPGTVKHIFLMSHGLSTDKICDYIGPVGLCSAPFGICPLTDYVWQCFKNRSLFFLHLSRVVLR